MIATGKHLRELRNRAGLSQSRLAELVGVTQAHIAKIENEKVDPRLSTVNRILNILLERDEKDAMKCRNIMSRNITSAKPDDDVNKIIKAMRDFDISQLPVFHKKANVGSVCESTIMRNFDRKLSKLRVRHIMDKPFPLIDADDSIEILPRLLDFHSAVLVSEKGKVRGIITKTDLLAVK